jgi:cation diffusion facilitator CzcD-associated flavoprotein CzcO
MAIVDTVVIGGGQAGLAVSYYLRRAGVDFVLLDDQDGPGGAWRGGWESLRLFSPARASSLPGWPMPRARDGKYPTRDEVVAYLSAYEERYGFPVLRPWPVHGVEEAADPEFLEVQGVHGGRVLARTVVSATGTWSAPRRPSLPGLEDFKGRILHSAEYRSPAALGLGGGEGPGGGRAATGDRPPRVMVVGGGNSGAQIVAEVSRTAETWWATLEPPVFLPDDVDGEVLFDQASARYRARQAGLPEPPSRSLGDIVAVPTVREARERGALQARPLPVRFTATGAVPHEGAPEEAVDAVILCTGFGPALEHLRPLGLEDARGRIPVQGTRSVAEPRLWLVGYGGWTGYASATLIGVGRTARATADEIREFLG